jgi:hypothetical protein
MIYFVEMVGADAVKIGSSYAGVNRRVVILQTASPFELRLLGIIPGNIAEEKQLHRRFDDHLIRGEWFRFSHIRSDIEELLIGKVTPPDIEGELRKQGWKP